VPVHPIAPPLRGGRLSAQRWQNLAFLHWAINPADVADLFPPGVRPDVLNGQTYVGLVPFVMRGAGPGPSLSVPYFGDFCETNIRLYSVDEQDRHGIVFLTLDAARLATVVLARLGLGLPYAWSRMSARRTTDEVRYESTRRWPRRRGAPAASGNRPHCSVVLRVGPKTEPTPVEVWLTARWGLHTRVAGRTLWVPNEHEPWPLHEASILQLNSDLAESCGIELDGIEPLRPLWSPGVRTRFGLPTILGR
jgi:uncharacterized protein YqjF (DUF2071 family)